MSWTKTTDAMPSRDSEEGGERWFLTWNEPTATYDVCCITRNLDQGYSFDGFVLGVTHWREITNDNPRH